MEHAHEMDIREMLDEVSSKMKYYESEYKTKQSCSYEVRHFYKKLYFNPGMYGPQKDDEEEKKESLAAPDKGMNVAAEEVMNRMSPKPERKGKIVRD